MIADKFRIFMTKEMGRPHTPSDEPWIEALNKNMKYYRDAPRRFPIADDVISWFPKLKGLYNNEPHSSLNYVTSQEAFDGKK
jgi:transposase InsO family protein